MEYTEVLLKFGKRSHMEEFSNGILYTSTPDIFKKRYESDPHRHDKYENLMLKTNKAKAEFTLQNIKSSKFTSKVDIESLTVNSPYNNITIFCMTIGIIKPCKNGTDIGYPIAMKDFGGTGVVIANTKEFLLKIRKACEAKGLGIQYVPVKYLKKNYAGKLDIFNKLETFSYQNEFRIAIYHKISIKDHYKLEIGNIKNIAYIFL